MSGKLVIVTIAIAIPFGAAAGYVVGDLTNQGEDRIGNAIVGGLGGTFGSLLLQFMVPALSGFDDWRAIVSQWAAAFVSGALLTVIVRSCNEPQTSHVFSGSYLYLS
jgi:hypothetical protein